MFNGLVDMLSKAIGGFTGGGGGGGGGGGWGDNTPPGQYKASQSSPYGGTNGPAPNPGQVGHTADTYSPSSGGSTAPTIDPADLAYLDDTEARLRRQGQSVDATLRNGTTQLEDSYNKEVSKANGQRSQAMQDFATKREDDIRNKDKAINTVDTNARTLANSLRQRLGLAAGSNSSAYQITAPAAVNRQASTQRAGVTENYATNDRDLTTSENRAKTAFEELLTDLFDQKKQRTSDFTSGILEKKNSIDASLAEVARQRALLKGGGYKEVKAAMSPYTSAIDSRANEIDSLFDKYRTPYAVKAVDTTLPSLRDYIVDKTTIGSNNSPVEDPFNPSVVKKRNEDLALA